MWASVDTCLVDFAEDWHGNGFDLSRKWIFLLVGSQLAVEAEVGFTVWSVLWVRGPQLGKHLSYGTDVCSDLLFADMVVVFGEFTGLHGMCKYL